MRYLEEVWLRRGRDAEFKFGRPTIGHPLKAPRPGGARWRAYMREALIAERIVMRIGRELDAEAVKLWPGSYQPGVFDITAKFDITANSYSWAWKIGLLAVEPRHGRIIKCPFMLPAREERVDDYVDRLIVGLRKVLQNGSVREVV